MVHVQVNKYNFYSVYQGDEQKQEKKNNRKDTLMGLITLPLHALFFKTWFVDMLIFLGLGTRLLVHPCDINQDRTTRLGSTQ